jgi:hypothetical protein
MLSRGPHLAKLKFDISGVPFMSPAAFPYDNKATASVRNRSGRRGAKRSEEEPVLTSQRPGQRIEFVYGLIKVKPTRRGDANERRGKGGSPRPVPDNLINLAFINWFSGIVKGVGY